MPRKGLSEERNDREPSLGFNVVTWDNDADNKSQSWIEGIENIFSIGVRRVTVVPYWFVDPKTGNVKESSRHDLPRGPTIDAIAAAMRTARKLGMNVSLKPMIEIDSDAELGEAWRGDLKISRGDYEKFFASYTEYIMGMAALAADCDVDRLYVGSELRLLTTSEHTTPYWSELIARARKFFPGGNRRLSYAANYDEYDEVTFWDQLDDIGIDAYFQLASKAEAQGDGKPDTASLIKSWRKILGKLHRFSKEWARPIVFSEFGLIPYEHASSEPWEWRPKQLSGRHQIKSKFDPREQLHAFEALLITMRNERDWLTAVDFWHWQLPNSEGSLYNISRETAVGKLIASYSAGSSLRQ